MRRYHLPRALRRRQTRAEARAWNLLRNRRLLGFKFRRQHRIGRFVVDFYCAELKLVIEIEGRVHRSPGREAYDRERRAQLVGRGLTVVRVPNKSVDEHTLRRVVIEYMGATRASSSSPPRPPSLCF